MVREDGRALLRDVVGAGGAPAEHCGSGRAARASEETWCQRARVRLGKPCFGAALEDGALRMSTMTHTQRFWRTLTLLARLDIAASVTIAAALLIWMAWH